MRIGPLCIERALPGELDGTLDPRDYGFEVIRDTPEELEAAERRLPLFIRQARMNFGLNNPALLEVLNEQAFDPEPARRLAAKHEALDYPVARTFGDAQLTIHEGVFDPTLTKVSPFLLKNIPLMVGEKVLDAFAGSGAFGVQAALEGAQKVVSFDNSPQAVVCAQQNAENNGLSEKIDVRLGTLHETIVPGESFDTIIANPPLIPGDPEKPLESALFDNGLQATKDFIAALPGLLAKRGKCYLVTSDVIDRKDYKVNVARLCASNSLTLSTVAQLHLPYESYRVHKITRRTPMTGVRTLLQKVAKVL